MEYLEWLVGVSFANVCDVACLKEPVPVFVANKQAVLGRSCRIDEEKLMDAPLLYRGQETIKHLYTHISIYNNIFIFCDGLGDPRGGCGVATIF